MLGKKKKVKEVDSTDRAEEFIDIDEGSDATKIRIIRKEEGERITGIESVPGIKDKNAKTIKADIIITY